MRKESRGMRWLLAVVATGLLALLGSGCSREAREARHLERANRHFQEEEYEKAEIEYRNVLRLDPQNPVAITRMGLLCFEQGRLAGAFAFLHKAEQLRPDDLDVRLKLGLTEYNLMGLKEAREEADYIVQKQPANDEALILLVEASATPQDLNDAQQRLQRLAPQLGRKAGIHVALGFLHLRRQDLTNAESEVKQAISLDSKSSAAYQVLGSVYLSRNEIAQAERAFKTASDLAPVRSARRLRYADFKIQTGDLDAAGQILNEITHQAPDYVPAWNRLAQIALAQKKYDDCDKLLKKALTKDPVNYEALMMSGRLKLAKGEGARAVAEFERISALYARSPEVKYQLAVAQLLDNNVTKATASLKEAIKLDPNNADSVLLLAQINLRKGDASVVVNSLTPLIKQRPQLAPAYLLLAEAQRAQGKLDDALAVYRRLQELSPKDPRTPLLIGSVYLQQEKKVEARKAFEQSLELAPDYVPALEQLVELDIADKQYATALQRIQALMPGHPKSPELQFFSARVYEAQEKTAQAEAALLRAIDLKADYRPAYLLLAKIYIASHRNQEALEKLQAVVAKNPKDTAALAQMGMIESEMKDYAKAADTYEKLLEVDPKFVLALNNLAYLYSERLGKVDRAYELAKRARDLVPNDPYMADTFGWILYRRGEYSWAANLIEESAQKLPAEPEIQFHLGMVHYALSEEAPARVALQNAVRSKKEFDGKSEAQRCLSVLDVEVGTADAKTVAFLEQRLSERSDDPVALAKLGAIQERDGAFEKARDTYEMALKQNSKNVALLMKLARLYSGHFQNPKRALELAKNARDLSPDDSTIARTLGRVAYQAGDFKWSLSLLQDAARRLSRDPEVLYDLAWAQYSLGRVADAEESMRSAVQLGAPFTRAEEARRFLAFVPLCNDSVGAQKSAAQIQDALKSDPSYVPALMAASVIYEQQGNATAAKQEWEKVLVHYPSFAPASKLLARFCVESGDFEKAYDYALKAREALPDDPEVAKTLGIVTYQRGDYKRAVQLLKESARKQTADAELYYYLGMAHYRLKEKSQSKEALRQSVALAPGAKFVEEAEKALAELK